MPCDNVPRCLKECAVCRLTGPFLVFVLLRQEANWLREIEVEALQKYSITTPCQQSSSLGAGREERNRRKREALCPPQAALGLEGLAFWRLWRGLPERAQGFAGMVFAPKVSWGACGKGVSHLPVRQPAGALRGQGGTRRYGTPDRPAATLRPEGAGYNGER